MFNVANLFMANYSFYTPPMPLTEADGALGGKLAAAIPSPQYMAQRTLTLDDSEILFHLNVRWTALHKQTYPLRRLLR